MVTSPILECKNLCVSYFTRAGEVPAVVGFDLKLMPGETVGLVGESGCGKSTIALAIMQFLGANGRIVDGDVLFHGQSLTTLSDNALRAIRGSKIAMVYQEPMASLNPSMKVGEQLAEVLICHDGASMHAARLRSVEMLDAVRLTDAGRVMEAYPHQLSGGQQQRIVIAMALLAKPDLLLLDEPTTALDVTVEAGIVDLIRDIGRDFGTSMIYISHNLGLIMETCDRVSVMYSGDVVEEGSIDAVFNDMRHPYTRGLFGAIPLPSADKRLRPLQPIRGQLPLPQERPVGCNFAPRCDHLEKGLCDKVDPTLRETDIELGHAVRCLRVDDLQWQSVAPVGAVEDDAPPGAVVLKVTGMKKYYQAGDSTLSALINGQGARFIKANEDISFVAREAETVAIVGESGCGKTTFAKVLMGLEKATSGSVELLGHEIGQVPVQKRTPQMVGMLQMVFQNPFDTLNPSHTVGGQIARVVRKFGVEKDAQRIEKRVFELLDLVKLPRDFASRRPRQLSGGQKQRVGIARAFAGKPSVMIADEPVSALDVSVQAAVTGLLADIQRDARTTLLFISHDLSVVRYLADRVVVMYLGHIVEQGATEQIFAPPYHPYTEALLSAVPIADTSIEKRRIVLEGDLPSAIHSPSGCPFHTRCPRKIGTICETELPPERALRDGHQLRCHLSDADFNAMEPVIVQAAE